MSSGGTCHYCRRYNCVCPTVGDPIRDPSACWISPTGEYLPCADGAHRPYAEHLCEKWRISTAMDEDDIRHDAVEALVRRGWVKILDNRRGTFGERYSFLIEPRPRNELPQSQFYTIMAFCNALEYSGNKVCSEYLQGIIMPSCK